MFHGCSVLSVVLACVLAAPAARAQDVAAAVAVTHTVRCESQDGREHHCPADTRGGVTVLRQLSRSTCEEGRTWGFDSAGIWVGQGCRADFSVFSGTGHGVRASAARVVRCESASGRSNLCVMDTRRGVELVRQLSRSGCIRDRNWGWDEQGVWVSGGCRAEFRARSDARGEHPPLLEGQSVRCESVDGGERHCPLDARGDVRLVRQLSRTSCLEGRNWGRDRQGVWVRAGCRADFEVDRGDDERWSGG